MCSASFQVSNRNSGTLSRTNEVRPILATTGPRIESVQPMAVEDAEVSRGRLVRSASVITPLTLLSRVTGYLRDKVIALTLGAGTRSDAFFVAFRIPNMLREIVGEGAMSSAFIPVYSEVSHERSEEEARAFVGKALATFTLILAALTVLGIVLSPFLVDLLARQFRQTPEKFTLTVTL